MPDAVKGCVTMEWLEQGKVALFRSHLKEFSGPAPYDGVCVVQVHATDSCEIKGMLSLDMGREKMLTGYRAVCGMMKEQGYTGVRMETVDEDGNLHVWVDGKRKGVIPCTAC
jgi:hypothetical protein